jgi:hypothetical protein
VLLGRHFIFSEPEKEEGELMAFFSSTWNGVTPVTANNLYRSSFTVMALVLFGALMSGCATWTMEEQGYPFFDATYDEEIDLRGNINRSWAELNAIAEIINANKNWGLEEVEAEILRRSLDFRQKGSYPEPIPEMIVSYNGVGRVEAYVWRFARIPQRSVSLPTSTWRSAEKVGYTLQVEMVDGSSTNIKASIIPLSDKNYEFSTRHFVSGTAATGASLYLLAGPAGP